MTQPLKTLTGEQALAAALGFYKAGRLSEAEALYRAVLATNPDHFDSLRAVGVLCLKRNAPQDAVAPLEKALALKPDSAETHNDLGMALAALNRHGEALPHLERAVALSPDFATAHNNLGNTLAALDRRRDAIAHFKRAIALRPGYALAEFNLANALSKSERHAEAADLYKMALEHNPDWAPALCGLGFSLHMSGRSAEGLQFYERALARDPASADAHNGIGQVKQTLGLLEESRSALERALELAPDRPSYHRMLGETKRFRAGDPQIAAMESLLPSLASLGEEQQAELHFALGKAYGDIARHEESFRHLIAGNAIKHRTDEYDEAAQLTMMKHIETVFTADLLRRNAGAGDPSEVPVFILGMPRSGSTLTEQILASHPRIFGAGELRDFSEPTKAFRGRDAGAFFPEVATSLSGEELRAFGARYVEHLRALAPAADRVTDKMPSNFRFIGFIRMTLPNAKIIHTRRDPIDTCISCFSRMFGKKSFMADLGTLGRYYRAYETLMAHWRRVLPQGAMLEVQYEDLVGDFENQARRIVAYCGVEWDERCLSFHQTERPVRTASVTQVRQPIYSNAIGRWKPYEMMLRPLLDELSIGKI
jgi:tetratricopeptide (TPR) repeat protein